MNTNTIFEKHWDALVTTAENAGVLALPAVRLALHLAIKDARDTEREMRDDKMDKLGQDRDSWRALAEGFRGDVADLHQKLTTLQQERTDHISRIILLEAAITEQPHYEDQQNRLMRWLIDNEPEASLTCDADQDVAGAIIDILEKQRLAIANYDTALSHAQNEAAMLRQQRADLQADLDGVQLRQELAQAAASPDPTPAPDWGPSHPAWQALTAEEQETIAKLAAGAIRFRSVPKEHRLILIGSVLRHIGDGSKITMAQYNRQRPEWMPEATSITQYVESNKWQDLVTVALMTASR